MKSKTKYMICGGLLGVSLLLLGAGRIGGGMASRKGEAEELKRSYQETAAVLSKSAPIEYRNSWDRLSESSPEVLIKACHTELRTALNVGGVSSRQRAERCP